MTRTHSEPAAEADSKPDSPADLSKPSWVYVARKTLREFSKDQCTDLAAALTYYAVLALFPAAIALLSLVGLFGDPRETVRTLTDVMTQLGAGPQAQTLQPTLDQLAGSSGAGIALLIGLLTALWSASGYVGSFGRAMNRIYEVDEGRPIWKLRPVMLAITTVTVVLVALVALALVLTGPFAEAIGNAIGIGSTVVTIWSIVKWPVILAVVVLIVALLYYATPNVQQPKFRWISIGAIVAIIAWVLASVLFGFYVSNFSSYNKTYGSLAGVVVFLLWLWLTNLALLFGAELDAELERGRELQAGIEAEETIQLPPRDTKKIDKTRAQQQEDAALGRQIRLDHDPDDDPDDEPEPDPDPDPDPDRDRGPDQTQVTTTEPERTMPRARTEKQSSTSAKILYQPLGLVSSVVAGLIAGQVFKQVWKHATPGDQEDAPKALESEYALRKVLGAALIQGAIFAVVKALVNRGGAKAFERWTGEWPGD